VKVGFSEACKDVLKNNTRYKRFKDTGIRKSLTPVYGIGVIEFFDVLDGRASEFQSIQDFDLNADWTLIKEKTLFNDVRYADEFAERNGQGEFYERAVRVSLKGFLDDLIEKSSLVNNSSKCSELRRMARERFGSELVE